MHTRPLVIAPTPGKVTSDDFVAYESALHNDNVLLGYADSANDIDTRLIHLNLD